MLGTFAGVLVLLFIPSSKFWKFVLILLTNAFKALEYELMYTHVEMVKFEKEIDEPASIKSFTPSKLYAWLATPFLSVVKIAPLTVPLFPLLLSSFALPLKGHQPINPFVAT